MDEQFDIQNYLAHGVERVIRETAKATLTNPKETLFLGKFALASKKASKLRKQEEEEGLHVPSFLITSITSACNLHCAGCYSRHNEATVDCEPVQQLSGEEWGNIFRQAEELGVSFILLAGASRCSAGMSSMKHPGSPVLSFPFSPTEPIWEKSIWICLTAAGTLFPL